MNKIKRTIEFFLTFILSLVTVFVTLILPGIYNYLVYKEYRQAKEVFVQPTTWKKQCSNNQKYCLHIATKGYLNQNNRYQKVIVYLLDTTNKKMLFSTRSRYIFSSRDLQGYPFRKFIVNRYKKRIVKPWLNKHYFISNSGDLFTTTPRGVKLLFKNNYGRYKQKKYD